MESASSFHGEAFPRKFLLQLVAELGNNPFRGGKKIQVIALSMLQVKEGEGSSAGQVELVAAADFSKMLQDVLLETMDDRQGNRSRRVLLPMEGNAVICLRNPRVDSVEPAPATFSRRWRYRG